MYVGKIKTQIWYYDINHLLVNCEGTLVYWLKVLAVRTGCSEVCSKTTKGQYSSVWSEQTRLVNTVNSLISRHLGNGNKFSLVELSANKSHCHKWASKKNIVGVCLLEN